MLESNSCVFLIVSIRSLMPWPIFAYIVPILPSNSGSVFKLVIVFTYELRFWRSGYQNRSEIFFGSICPLLCQVENFYFGQKLVTRSSFRGHKLFVNFEHVFWISTGHTFHLFELIFSVVTSFVLLSEKNIKKIKRKSRSFLKKQRQPKKIEKREGQKRNNI